MADVFISYKREDRRYAEALHQYLTAHGFSTWWDTRLIAGESFNTAIERELDAARCVLVLWSKASHESEWVQAEAIFGFGKKNLVAASLDNVKLKYPFGLVQTANLQRWNCGQDDERLAGVLEGVELKVGRKALPGQTPAPLPAATAAGVEGAVKAPEASKLLAEHMHRFAEAAGAVGKSLASSRGALIGLAIAAVLIVAGAGGVFYVSQSLPNVAELTNYEPPMTTRVYAGDGALAAELSDFQRIPVPLSTIPDHVIQAFQAAHSEADILREVSTMVAGRGTDLITRFVRRPLIEGRVRQALDDERMLELFLNDAPMAPNVYGVAAGALSYFNKPLSELTIAESAFLASIAGAPNLEAIAQSPRIALDQRNALLNALRRDGVITAEQAEGALAEDIAAVERLAGDQFVAMEHFAAEVRRQVAAQYGDGAVESAGLAIRSTVDTRLQLAGVQALRAGLEAYDRRHAWRGPIGAGNASGDISAQLRGAATAPRLSHWLRAMVTSSAATTVDVTDENGATGRLLDDDVSWTQAAARSDAARALRPGSIIYASRNANGRYTLRQVPQVQGALIAMDPHTGAVLAMINGYSFGSDGELNRATQMMRQPGAAHMPILYAAALDYGLTPATLVDDGPLSIEAGNGEVFSPENDTREYYGPTTLRRGLELARNAMTARLAYEMGVDRVLQYGQRLGVYGEDARASYGLALGGGETTLMRMTTAYGVFVNGGRRIRPIFIERIQDRDGLTIFRRDQRECSRCSDAWRQQRPPTIADGREQILDPVTAYQIVSMAEGVVQRGTSTVASGLGFPLGGMPSTSQQRTDAWFIGFSVDLVVGVWVGFDELANLGEGETGARVAAPIFREFMREALRDEVPAPFRIAPGVRLVRIDAQTGLLPNANTANTILEAFRPDTEPSRDTGQSPFVFGGLAPPEQRRRQQEPGEENLGDLY